MSRGYGKYRRGNYHNASFQFDNLFKENSNKPSAARSTGTVGKWGITSFTSIRAKNGLAQENDKSNGNIVPEPAAVPKPKKFFKSRNSDSESSNASGPTATTTKGSYKDTYAPSTPSAKRQKVDRAPAKRRNAPKAVASQKGAAAAAAATTAACLDKDSKQKIVLRIVHGKSEIVNESDQSESTVTPSSTPSTSTLTSPRAQRSPSHARVTRSTRRSLQQDHPSSSPATADTANESFSLFTSPKKDADLSPQYIPAEKYEMERKAMYANLLGTTRDQGEGEDDDGEDHDKNIDAEIDLDDSNRMQVDDQDPDTEEQPVIEKEEPDDKEERLKSPEPEPDDITSVPEEVEVGDKPKVASEAPIIKIQQTIIIPAPSKPDPPPRVEDEWSSEAEDEPMPQPEVEQEPESEPYNEQAEIEKAMREEVPVKSTIEEHKEEILDKILEPTSLKVVISKKKGSIFKSRAITYDGPKKTRAVYRHKWSGELEPTPKPSDTVSSTSVTTVDDEFGFNDDPLVKVPRNDDGEGETANKVKCTRNDKGFYTVVRNVKKAHQMQEIGEFQEFNDDVEYILDALQDNNPISTRCLSAITLATKCMAPAFRMHVRAHGTVAKFFKALHDATRDQSLGLCTATVMFVLSQDRLNMDLDRDCLELMLNLLESDVNYQQALDICGLSSSQLEKNKQKVRELCAEIQSQGHAMHLNLDNITVGQLAMETLLSLTSKRAGEWFKEELRELGGLEHIMKTICECCRQVSDYVVSWTDTLLDKLRKIDRCLRVLENVTHNNEENQLYLLNYDNGILLDTLVKLYRLCDSELPLYPVADIADKETAGAVIREALLVTLKVLINLTHRFNKQSTGSTLIGARPGIIDSSLHLLLQVPQYIPEQKKFELGVLVLMLLINLIQDNEANKRLLIGAKAPAEGESVFTCEKFAVEALVKQFHQWEECARVAEKRTDAILDGEKDETSTQPKTNEEFIEETVAKLLQKAGTHMEFTFLASYLVLLVGYLIMDNAEYETTVRGFLKDKKFELMVELLKKFFSFMNLTSSTEASSVCAMKATEKVIKYLEDCDKSPEEKASSSDQRWESSSMDLSFSLTHH